MEKIIFNTILNVSSEDVNAENDLKILSEWKNVLTQKNNEIKVRLETARIEYHNDNSEKNKSILIRTSDARNHNVSFINIIDNRIKQIKKQNGQGMSKYIQNLINFKEIAKLILPEDLYEEINLKAKLKTEEK
jgi:hypothetical protein